MLKVTAIQCAVTATFQRETPEAEPVLQSVTQTAAQVEGQWYGDGAMGIPFTEDLTQTELHLLNELLTTVAARVAKKKQDENARAAMV
ncbi:MAG TPA: hypothetical protein VF297_05190 [Pyrinomonadaceae bacterium]